MEIKCDAVVLKATDYRDNDKLLTLFAAGYGKLTAVCRGVKKAGAKLKFAAQPFSFCEYVLAEKNDRHTVVSAFQHDGFFALREDVVRYYAASAVLEACNLLLPEGQPVDRLFSSCVRTLGELSQSEGNGGEKLLGFYLTALACAGYALRTDGCLSCGKPIEKRGAFSFAQGGFFCKACGAGDVPVSEITYQTLLAVQAGKTPPEGDGVKRALRLIKEFFVQKTECRTECLSEYIRLI